MDTIARPGCTAQHTDDLDTWGCTGHHLGDYHVAEDGGVAVRLWRDPDQPATGPDYGDLVAAVERVVARLRGRACDPDIRAVIAAYDQLTCGAEVAS